MRAQKQQIKLTTLQCKVNSLLCQFKLESLCNNIAKIAKYTTLNYTLAVNFLFLLPEFTI